MATHFIDLFDRFKIWHNLQEYVVGNCVSVLGKLWHLRKYKNNCFPYMLPCDCNYRTCVSFF